MELIKSIQYLKISLKLRYFFIFSHSLTPQTRNIECACAHVFQKRTWGGLIGAFAINRANTVFVLS